MDAFITGMLVRAHSHGLRVRAQGHGLRVRHSMHSRRRRRLLYQNERPAAGVSMAVEGVPPEAKSLMEGENSRHPTRTVVDTEEIRRQGRALSGVGWLAWWIELPLTATAAGILAFALFTKQSSLAAGAATGLAFGVACVITCFTSILFAWGYTALGRRMIIGDEAPQVLRVVRFGLYVAVFGAMIALIGVQSVVGTTLGKALSSGLSSSTVVQQTSTVSALDLLIVQGCVNALMSQFVALLVALNLLLRFRSRRSGP